MQYVIVYGSLVDGYEFVGPFEDRQAAQRFIDGKPSYYANNYWIARLRPPSTWEP